MDRIRIEGLEVESVIGVYPHEQTSTQPLVVDAELFLSTEASAVSESLSDTVHYGLIAQQISFVLEAGRFRLLETAGHALAKLLLIPPAKGERRASIERVGLRIRKPHALKSLANASIQICRDSSWARYTKEIKPFGTVDIVHESQDAGIYRLNVAPGSAIPMHMHRTMTESELVLTDELFCQHLPAPQGSVRHWPQHAPHLYENRSERWQSILCIDQPRFHESDEIPVDDPAADVPFTAGWV